MTPAGIFARLRAMMRDVEGAALIEFAIVLPVTLTLYYGSIQLQDGFACSRKVTIATRAVADLAAQNLTGETNIAEIDSALAASTLVLAPFKASPASIRLSEVTTNPGLITKVVWSRARNGTAYKKNEKVDIPIEMKVPGTYFLLAEVSYEYQPPAFLGDLEPITFRDQLYMLPRNSDRIDCTDCK
jgi:Flp pilus assembly protein TadG